ncbi:hypothetical protein [Spiroplasma citri]|uniref:hypothetical protein n=1 Tax=Spiroplasma citri TaxID=2133 RepID=UPI001EF9150B|nr:hypothetical protein [Spiroplasma citri]
MFSKITKLRLYLSVATNVPRTSAKILLSSPRNVDALDQDVKGNLKIERKTLSVIKRFANWSKLISHETTNGVTVVITVKN